MQMVIFYGKDRFISREKKKASKGKMVIEEATKLVEKGVEKHAKEICDN